jgi:hypothetical protein
MKIAAMAAFAFCVSSTGVAFAQAKAPADKQIAQAEKVCVTGSDDRYGHPSNACWVAHDAAVNRQDFDRAISFARAGCEKYGRADFCLLTSRLQQQPGQVVAVGAAGAARAAGDALLSASRGVTALDLEDGERGILMREARQRLK